MSKFYVEESYSDEEVELIPFKTVEEAWAYEEAANKYAQEEYSFRVLDSKLQEVEKPLEPLTITMTRQELQDQIDEGLINPLDFKK